MAETAKTPRQIGYARVSTYGQTLDAQLEQLRANGCSRIYREKVSGAKPDRRELLWLLGRNSVSSRVGRLKAGGELNSLSAGDVVAVTRIDRLARSTFNLFAVVKRIVDADGQFQSLAEPWAETWTSTGRLTIAVLGGSADVERDLIRTPPGRGTRPLQGARPAYGPTTQTDPAATGRGQEA